MALHPPQRVSDYALRLFALVRRVRPAATRRLAAFALAAAVGASIATAQGAGDIVGRVVDEMARPIVGARIELAPESRRTVSDDKGAFAYRGLTPGSYVVAVQRIGYKPNNVRVNVGSGRSSPTIVLEAIARVLDSVRIVERQAPNRYSATVLDASDRPVPDVAVTVEGLNHELRTDATGHFAVPGEVHGTLVLRMRKIGYLAYLGSLRVLASRSDTLRMSRLSQGLSAVEITEASGFGRDTFAYAEMDQRMRWRDQRSGVISHEELAQMGRMDLCTALSFTPTGLRSEAGRACESACVIVDGQASTSRPARAYSADQVELVEYYPPHSDGSGSLAARGCGGHNSTLVIWLIGTDDKR